MTRQQQKRLNAMCGDLERQIVLDELSGRYVAEQEIQASRSRRIDKDSWRWMFVGTFKGWKAVPAIEGAGFIMLGASSRSLTVEDASAVIEMLYAFGSERGVSWSDPKEQALMSAYEAEHG